MKLSERVVESFSNVCETLLWFGNLSNSCFTKRPETCLKPVWSLFSGKIDGLSLESKWSQKNTFHNISNETSYLEIKYNETFKFYRILVKNDQLQIWNKKSYVISHKIKRQMSSNYNDNDDDNNDNDDDDDDDDDEDINLVNNINKTIVSD